MKNRLILILCCVITLTSCLLTGCNYTGNNSPGNYSYGETAFATVDKSTTAEQSKPLTINVLINETYCKNTACKCIQHLASREYGQLLESLKSRYNINLHLTYCMEEDSLPYLLKTGNFDGVICKPWFAFQLMPSGKFKFTRIADILDPFDNEFVSGIFIVKKDSPLQTPEDIDGKKLALGTPDSYEKYHLPMTFIADKGIKPSEMIHKGGCTECLDLLMDDKADAAVISDYALIASCAVDFADEDAFRTIYKTDDIPLASVIIDLNKVSSADAARLQRALLDVSANGIPADFASKGFVKPAAWTPVPYKSDN